MVSVPFWFRSSRRRTLFGHGANLMKFSSFQNSKMQTRQLNPIHIVAVIAWKTRVQTKYIACIEPHRNIYAYIHLNGSSLYACLQFGIGFYLWLETTPRIFSGQGVTNCSMERSNHHFLVYTPLVYHSHSCFIWKGSEVALPIRKGKYRERICVFWSIVIRLGGRVL